MPDTKEKLLIVDDEPSIRTLLSSVLAEIGYRVRTAEDGFSALIEMRKEIPDILLSDLTKCLPAWPRTPSIKKAAAWARC